MKVTLGRKSKAVKRGRDSQKKSKVLVMAENSGIEKIIKKSKTRKVVHLKMAVIEDLISKTITSVVEKSISPHSSIDTYDST
jgi:hypothetical protein